MRTLLNTSCLFMLLAILLVGASCEGHRVLPVEPDLPEKAGLEAKGDLYIFSNMSLAGLPGGYLLSMDDEGLHRVDMPASPLLVRSRDLYFDRNTDEVCGVFREPEDTRLSYACYTFGTGAWRQLSPANYSIINGAISEDGRYMYQVLVRALYEDDSPWYYAARIELATGDVSAFLPVDSRLAFGSPQRITVSKDGRHLFILSAPFAEDTYQVELEKPYVLQIVDVAEWQIVHERRVPAFITYVVNSEDGEYVLLYSNEDDAVYRYHLERDEVSQVLVLERTPDLLYTPWLLSTPQGVIVIDQSDRHTTLRALSADASTWETFRFDFLAHTVVVSEDGRIVFREYHLSAEDFAEEPMRDREETFHIVDPVSFDVIGTRTVHLPGNAFYSGLFTLLADHRNL